MPLVPNNVNPLQDFVTPGQVAAMTIDGIVVDKIYAATGVIDSINNNNQLTYRDPNTNQVNNTGQVSIQNSFGLPDNGGWVSDYLDDQYNTAISLNFNFNRITYFNHISFDIIKVPCTWTLYRTTASGQSQIYTGVIIEYNPNDYQTVEVDFDKTLEFDSSNSLTMVITKSPTGTQYPVGLENFSTKLIISSYSDIVVDNTIISGLVTQNSLGFIEYYTPVVEQYSNMIGGSESVYWKSSPQPVKDAVVYFIVDLGYRQTVNTMFIDPLYTGNAMNIYYSDVYSTVTSGNTDSLTWYPVNRDFTLKKGTYRFSSISTRYIKMEFSQLTAEVYDLPLDSVQRTIQVYPDWLDGYYTSIEQSISNTAGQQYYPLTGNPIPNVAYNTSPNIPTNYGLAATQLSSNTYGGVSSSPNDVGLASYGSNPNTYSIVDPTNSYKTIQEIAGVGAVYNNANSPTFINRRFFTYGQHYYKNVTLNQTWYQAYFTGIKNLQFYASSPLIQNDAEEWLDYFFPTVINGTAYASANTIISGTSTTLMTSGGYTGSATSTLQTYNLRTISSINAFKFSALNTEWQEFLPKEQTLLQGKLNVTGVTISGANYSVSTNTEPYGIYTLSGILDPSYIQSANGGSQNLLTLAQANFTVSGWSTGSTISGTSNTLINSSIYSSFPGVYGDEGFASNTFGGTVQQSPAYYTFLVTSSGVNGTVQIVDNFFYNGGTFVASSGSTFAVAASGTPISFTVQQPLNTNQVNISLTASGSGSVTYSKSGLFIGQSAVWSTPLVLQNMRISAVARINLPNTSYGTYRCSLLNAAGQELAYKTVAGIPTQTWIDIEVPYTVTDSLTNNNGFSVKLTQTHGIGEVYQLAMLGIFYNPVAYQFSTDQGTTWWNITTGIGNPTVNINLPNASQQLMIKATLLQDNTVVSAMDIVPVYTQTPFYTNTIIDYLGDPKVNEMSIRKPAQLRPLFQLNTDLYPSAYSQQQLLNILAPFKLI